ncbi:lysoplasmalogenase [Pseudenhygromyxa sp. WMMC2535]|uniref:lysoplasmalogenase n=1 Tax=Pseudenhygromyxa sp. WMMC2535 TaxID=2712867 RepID=UPI001551D5FD|nr:lysoplasmalogenase [Pseudenhygromyxa sp. WMMC2535]NVB41044.1 lysoplasmalogenase [Pseudenhygromyxa sp. WMMC2535]
MASTLAEIWVAMTLVALGLHLWAEQRRWSVAIAVTKLIASTGFLLTAHAVGALDHGWSRWLFVGLCLSWVGDACLLSRARPAFLGGLVAFLLGHVAYCLAFWRYGVDASVALTMVPPLLACASLIERWLRPGLDTAMRGPVLAYIVVISTMLALAVGAWWAGASHLLLIGALSFYLSDLFVARDRFVREEFFNRLCGLPAYYLGQICLALAVLGLR